MLHEHTYMHIQDIWQAADVSPDENRPCIIKMKRNMNKTVASQLPDGHEEDDQEGPAHKKLWRTNVKPTALKIVADVMKKYTGTATKPAYAELEKEARNELKKGFQTPPIPIFTKVIHVTNMRNIWQWILDGALQDVHPEDLNTHGRELKGPEDCRLSQKTTQQAPPSPPPPPPLPPPPAADQQRNYAALLDEDSRGSHGSYGLFGQDLDRLSSPERSVDGTWTAAASSGGEGFLAVASAAAAAGI